MRRLRVLRKDELDLHAEECDLARVGPREVLVELRVAGINRSDVSAALGRMP